MHDNTLNNLPIFQGYTVDAKLKEFRKKKQNNHVHRIPFDSLKGKALIKELLSGREIEFDYLGFPDPDIAASTPKFSIAQVEYIEFDRSLRHATVTLQTSPGRLSLKVNSKTARQLKVGDEVAYVRDSGIQFHLIEQKVNRNFVPKR